MSAQAIPQPARTWETGTVSCLTAAQQELREALDQRAALDARIERLSVEVDALSRALAAYQRAVTRTSQRGAGGRRISAPPALLEVAAGAVTGIDSADPKTWHGATATQRVRMWADLNGGRVRMRDLYAALEGAGVYTDRENTRALLFGAANRLHLKGELERVEPGVYQRRDKENGSTFANTPVA